jgi:chromosome partitioning protein
MSRVVAFNSLKGGVGKTTCTIFLAEHLQALGKRLLLVDLDPQHSLTTYYLARGFEPAPGKDVLSFMSGFRGSIRDVAITREGLSVVPGTMRLAEVTTRPLWKWKRRHMVRRLASVASMEEYDFVLIDTAPTVSLLSLISLPVTQYMILVTTPEVWAVRAINLYLESLPSQIARTGSRLTDVAVVTNSYDRTRKNERDVIATMKETLPDYVVEPPIPFSKAVRNYVLQQKERARFLEPVRDAVAEIASSVLGVSS